MSLVQKLLLRLLAYYALPGGCAWFLAAACFPLEGTRIPAVEIAVTAALLAFVLVAVIALAAMAAPVQRAAGLPPGEERSRAALAALRLPGRLAGVLLAVACALIVSTCALLVRFGLALDLAVAVGVAGAALAVMAAMLGYGVAATGLASTVAALGAPEPRERATMAGKVLAVGYGLVAVSTLLVGAVAYARYRADTAKVYLESAREAQGHAARFLPARGPGEVAELVWLSTGAPTAIVARDGSVPARAGLGDEGLLREAAPAGEAVEPVRGGWLVRRPAGPYSVVTFLSEEPLRARRQAFLGTGALLGLALLAVASLLVWLMARTLTVPVGLLGQAAGRIASGDLTVSPPIVTRDEMAQLASDFRKMTLGLGHLVREVQAATLGVQEGARETGVIGDRVREGASEEHHRVLAVQAAVEAMRGSVAMVGKGVEALADYVHSTSAAVGEMAAALEEVKRQASELENRSGAAAGDVDRLSEAGRRAQAQLGALGGLAGHAQGSLSAVSASLSGLETSAIASQLAAAQAAEMAEHAGGVVQEALVGIEDLRAAVGDAKKRVTVLGRRSDDIDQILDFIAEVAGRTNLLSLNASIIATQAGEHGKAFAVVADQIGELAAQISASTKSIAEIIGAVRDDVSGTARFIDRGDGLAAEGVARARKSLDALQAITAATARGHETAAAIREAVLAHGSSTRDVSDLVGTIAENSGSLGEALQMVNKSVAAVGLVSRAVTALADEVVRAIEEQSGVGRRQLQSLEKINAMLADVGRAVENHDAATTRVREALSHLTRTAEQHDGAVIELSGVAGRLETRSRALAQSVGKFKI